MRLNIHTHNHRNSAAGENCPEVAQATPGVSSETSHVQNDNNRTEEKVVPPYRSIDPPHASVLMFRGTERHILS